MLEKIEHHFSSFMLSRLPLMYDGSPDHRNPGGIYCISLSETTISLTQASFQETLRSLHGELQKLLRLSHGKTGPQSL